METNRKFLTLTVLILAFVSISSSITSINEFYLSEFAAKIDGGPNLEELTLPFIKPERNNQFHQQKGGFIQRKTLNQLEVNDSSLKRVNLLKIGELDNPLNKSDEGLEGLKVNTRDQFTVSLSSFHY